MIPIASIDVDTTGAEFTWTEWGHFPISLNHRLLRKLHRQFLMRQLLPAVSSSSSLTSLLLFHRAPSVQALLASTNQNASTFSLNSEFRSPLLLASGVHCSTMLSGVTGEEFNPSCEFIGRSPAFFPGNGVSEALGVNKLNSLLKRTQQEFTHSLITGAFLVFRPIQLVDQLTVRSDKIPFIFTDLWDAGKSLTCTKTIVRQSVD